MKNKMKIAIDIDEVLMPLLRPMAAYHRVVLPTGVAKYPYLFREAFKVSEEKSQYMLREYYDSEEFRNTQPIEGSQRFLRRYRFEHPNSKLYVVTGRQNVVRLATEEWLDQHYEGVFDDLILTNSFTRDEIFKSSVCLALNADLIIDDNFGICRDCEARGTDAINFIGDPVYPWCKENAIATKSWLEMKIDEK
jgi:5'(3')-deoxyribonucleotidase